MLIGILLMVAVIFTVIFWLTENYEIAAGIICCAGVFAIFWLGFWWWPSFECEQKVAPSGYECTWDFFAGCQVKIDNRYVPYEKWRVME